MRNIVLTAAALAMMGLQSCTPVFAQGEASKGSPHPESAPLEKTREPAQQPDKPASKKKKKEVEKKLESKPSDDTISTSDTEKAVFEKKPNEPSTWDKVKEKTGDAVDYSKEKAEEAVEYGSEKSQSIGRTLGAARSRRLETEWTLTGNYSLFEMWTLSKYGLTVGYNENESTTYEFEYMRGSLGFGYFGIDLGSFDEERFGLNWRSYGSRNSFSFITGLYYNTLTMKLGNEALASVAGSQRTHVDILEIQTVGINWGIGNRWQTKGGFVWGADWISINIPVWIVKQEHPFIDATNSERFREDAKDALRIFRRIPEIAALKIQLGFSF